MKWTVVFLVLLVNVFGDKDELVVKIKSGLLRGMHMTSREGRQFKAFLGIQYGQPPIGELRFQPPVPAKSWDGVKSAIEDGVVCMQTDFITRKTIGSENCLYLNVYTPKMESNLGLPVMVWIHGGGFVFGSGGLNHYEPDFFMDEDVVLVSINYRLGALGFLTTGDDVISANNGLKDQILALKWVQENIESFGGDPRMVTIFGESAGAASAHHLMLSPLSKGLFHSVISQSGTALCNWAVQTSDEGVRATRRLAKTLSCPISSSSEMVECLRKKPAPDFIEATKTFIEWLGEPWMVFKPSIEADKEGSVLPDNPANLISTGKAMDVPWMTGVTSEEAAFKVAGMMLEKGSLSKLSSDFEKYFPIMCSFSKEILEDILGDLKRFYFKNPEEISAEKLERIYSDTMQVFCAVQSVDLHRKYMQEATYMYLFSYKGSKSMTQLLSQEDYDVKGVSHADDLFYLFPWKSIIDKPLSEVDREMSKVLVGLWTNFAKFGNPNGPNTQTTWEPVSKDSNKYLNIKGPDDLKMEENLFKERMDFWRSLKVEENNYKFYKDEL